MIDPFELAEEAFLNAEIQRDKQRQIEVKKGNKNFRQFELKYREKFLLELDKFFGERINCQVIAFNSAFYDPLNYVDINWVPDYMTVECPGNKEYRSFKLKIYNSELRRAIFYYYSHDVPLQNLAQLYPYLKIGHKKVVSIERLA